PRLTPILPRLADHNANQAEANALTQNPFTEPSSAAAALLALGVREAVVTDGPAAAAVAHAEGEHALSPPLDIGARATGAGDALAAAYLHRRLRGDPPERALAAGLAAAAVHRSGP
ncbi:MAG: PfkB family carbohydrate kinase, partial [Pseudomonadota bacterium]